MTRLLIASALWLAGCAGSSGPLPPGGAWTPAAWRDESTIVLRSDCPAEGEYWFPVWLVVLDDQLYVRLGSKAAGRMECTRGFPDIGVRVGGQQFDRVHTAAAPEMAERVQAAMRDKYWTDVFVRGLPHPMTLRITPVQ